MKGLSPEMFNVIEADIFHVHGRQHGYIRKGEDGAALSGSETGARYQEDCLGTWRSRAFSRHGSSGGQTEEGKEATTMLWKSDQPHRRGVVRVMSGASTGLTRRGWQLHAERGGKDTHHA